MEVGTRIATVVMALTFALPASVEAQERGQRPIAMSLEGCEGFDAATLRRVLAAEVGVQVVAGDAIDQHLALTVRVQCLPGFVRVSVDDPGAEISFVRFVDIEREAAPARMRVLALAIVEAMEAGDDRAEPADGRLVVPPSPTKRAAEAANPPLVPAVKRVQARRPESSAGCVPRDVFEAVLQCPAGAAPARRSSRPRVIAGQSAHDDEPRPPTKATPGLSDGVVQAERGGHTLSKRARQRSIDILRRVVAMGKRLVDTTPDDDREWSPRVLRLAADYGDLSEALHAKTVELDERIFAERRRGENETTKALRRARRALEREEARRREDAIAQYQRWSERFPDAPNRDRVLYVMGGLLEENVRAYEQRASSDPSPELPELVARNVERASAVYQTLLERHPGSNYAPYAELFFAKTAYSQGHVEEALGHYRKLARSKNRSIAPWAMYKSAWCQVDLGRDREAVTAFAKAAQFAAEHSDAPLASSIARQALLEMVEPFSRSLATQPRHAWQYFKRVGGDMAVEMMERLAQRYLDQGQWAEALGAYKVLIDDDAAESRSCFYRTQSVKAGMRTLPKAGQVALLRQAVASMDAFVAGSHQASDELECRQAVATLLLDAATSWHHEAVGPTDQEGTGDAATMALASDLYDVALEEFPDLDELELEGWDEDSRPTVYRVSYWQADLLYARRMWSACGPAFDRVVDMDTGPGAELLEEAAYSAVLCYDRLYESSHVEGSGARADAERTPVDDRAPREFTLVESAMLGAYTRYLCFVSESEDLTRIGYRRARVHLEANHLEEAAILFREVAYSAPADELGQEAALYYLEALHAVGRADPVRFRACRDDMERAVDHFLSDSRIMDNDRVGTELTRTRCSIMWSRAEDDANDGAYGRCAALYLDIYDRYREPCEQISGHGLDEVLHNAAYCLEADARVGRAIEVRQTLIDEFGDGSRYAREHGGKVSPLAARAIYDMGRAFQDMAYFTKAAERYETFATRYPGEEESRAALQNATLFRMKLGQHEQALEDARLFEKSYGRSHKAETAEVLLSVGTVFTSRKQWREAAEHYHRFLRRYEREMSPDVTIRGHVAAGYAMWQQNGNHRRQALVQFDEALKIADRGRHDGESASERLARYKTMLDAPSGEAAGSSKLASMIDAVAKARFYRAEERFEQFSSIQMPPFKLSTRLSRAVRRWWIETQGRETVSTVERAFKSMSPADRLEWFHIIQTEHWAATELTRWLDRRREAHLAAMELYKRAAAEDVPAWEIASAKRVGDMYRSTLQALVDAPIPEDFEARRGELVQQYREYAVGAYVTCLRESTKNQWFDGWSRSCERELSRLMPREYPIADEIRSAPVHARSPMAAPDIIREDPRPSSSP